MSAQDPEHSDSSSEDSDDESVEVMEAPELSHAEHKVNGNNSYKTKDYRGAIAHYTLAISSATDSSPPAEGSILAAYFSNRAAAFSMILQYDKVIADCDSAISADRSFTKAYFRKARTLTIQGRLDEAIKAYSFGMVRDPNNSQIVKDKEEVQQLQKRFTLAKNILVQKQKQNNNKVTRKDALQVLRQMEMVLSTCNQWKEALYLKTTALFYLRRTDDAYALTTTLVRMGGLENNSNDLVLLRAKILFQMGNTDDAIKHLRQILSGDPDNKQAFTILKYLKNLGKKKEQADIAYKTRKYQDAIASYGEAILLCSDDDSPASLDSPTYISKLYFNRASAHANLRQHTNVIEDCSSALDFDDSYLKAYARRAASHLMIAEESNCNQAIRDYEKAASLTSNEEQQREYQKKIRSAQVALKRSKRKDFYKVLGVAKDANESEIKKGYRKLALKWHPDRHANSTDKQKEEAEKTFRDVNLAYEVLSDPTKKQRYDDGVEEQDLDNPHATAGGHRGGGGMGGIDPNDLFEMFMRQQSGGSRRGGGGGGQSFHFG